MKVLYLICICLLAAGYSKAQNIQLVSNYNKTVAPAKLFFYNAVPDSAFCGFVKYELRSMSDFYMLTTHCYYYDSLNVVTNTPVQPDFKSNNVFVNADFAKIYHDSTAVDTSIVNLMVHQCAGIIIQKYKLTLDDEQQLLLMDYLSGYYLACRYRNPKMVAISNVNSLEINKASDEVAIALRQVAFEQGQTLFKSNYKLRKTFTLHDVIQAGLDFTAELY